MSSAQHTRQIPSTTMPVPPTLQEIPAPRRIRWPVLKSIVHAGAISTARKCQINSSQALYDHLQRASSLCSRLCRPFNAHRASLVERFSPTRF
jgi:hypothetical protein